MGSLDGQIAGACLTVARIAVIGEVLEPDWKLAEESHEIRVIHGVIGSVWSSPGRDVRGRPANAAIEHVGIPFNQAPRGEGSNRGTASVGVPRHMSIMDARQTPGELRELESALEVTWYSPIRRQIAEV